MGTQSSLPRGPSLQPRPFLSPLTLGFIFQGNERWGRAGSANVLGAAKETGRNGVAGGGWKSVGCHALNWPLTLMDPLLKQAIYQPEAPHSHNSSL